ncbi:hypothetical protein [Hydrogenimonas thermophila]|uniref:Uncharacterized protein n=1 Tax=Hydrogenimonas thermophila TaxID=223786 RepID=A0A1I5NGC5_9BACT|nr:hypothetical protein [Hydrogenimonas thermophila]WOE69845.1 hypothetical protein RZR91_12165 [Hydrogenimonas thermophila]WOE72360.1 hypothetical protein RZR97_12160 [Hydrogenimonas thermophila]SFP20824.1 hypothetical protein SAMN05216234_11041 [Hydrogenimonas thermophila]
MAVSPLTNIVFINQNMHVAAGVQTAQFNRYDLQNIAAQALVNEKEKIVEEVRPVEESYKVDPDREHEREKAKEQEEEREQAANHKPKSKESDAEKSSDVTIDEDGNPHLDILV